MSPSDELRAERLRALHRKLLGTELQERYGHLYHAAIRSDDPVLQSMIDENVVLDAEIPPSVREDFFFYRDGPAMWWLPELTDTRYYAGPSNDPEMQSLFENPRSTVRSFVQLLSSRHGTDFVPSGLGWELSKAVWRKVRTADNSRIGGFKLFLDGEKTDLSINGLRWSGRIHCDDEFVNDGGGLLYEELDELGLLVCGELFTVKETAGLQCPLAWAFHWIEVLYALLPQTSEMTDDIQSVMLPWNLADASARAIEVLIEKPNWRFDAVTRAKKAVQFTPAELRDRLGDIDSNTLLKYARLAEVNTPSRGKRGHRYDNSDVGAICNAIIRSTATTGLRQAAKDLLKELTGESSD